jgi:hypothetical protein
VAEEEVPSAQEIMQLAEQVMLTARRIRVEHELNPQAMGNRGAPAAAAREAIQESGYSWVPEYFESHVGPEPSGLDGPIEVMREAESKLYNRDSGVLPIQGFLDDLDDYLGSAHWDGDAANKFRTNFLRPIEAVTKNQSLVAFTLKHALVADKELYVRVRQNLKDTASKTIVALEAIAAFCTPGEIVVVLSVASAVATAAAVVATLGTAAPAAIAGWALVAGATSGTAGVVGTLGDPAGAPRDLAAETVDGVLQNMIDVITEIQGEVYRQERDIITTLQNDLDLMVGQIVTLPNADQRSTSEDFLTPRPDYLIEPAERATNDDLPEAEREEARQDIFESFQPRP